MGEIAEMMLDGTMDPETGEWNFDGEDGPGWPMTGAEAAAYKREHGRKAISLWSGWTAFKLTKAWRKKLEVFGEVIGHDAYHWQVRKDGKVVADWWPHKDKWKIGRECAHGPIGSFRHALEQHARATQ
jgi:hypothetical protein